MGEAERTVANDVPAKPKGLVSKLAEVMQAVERVAKRGRNEFHKYDYVTEADLADAIRGELAKRQLFIFPHVKKYERIPIEVETLKWDEKLRMKVPTARKTQLAEIEVEWTFVDGETGQERTIMVPGVGEDNVDKGFYKAFTGSEKYMLMKSFLIPTGDDPEKDSKEEASDARKEGTVKAQEVAQEKIAAHKQKARERVGDIAIPCLFYVWHEESKTAEITGADEILKAQRDVLKNLWNKTANAIVADATQLEDLKYTLEQRGVIFRQLQSA